jgi:hypothetical protein
VCSSTSFSILIYTHGAHWAIILLIDQGRALFNIYFAAFSSEVYILGGNLYPPLPKDKIK